MMNLNVIASYSEAIHPYVIGGELLRFTRSDANKGAQIK
jgi:hypothetical protein